MQHKGNSTKSNQKVAIITGASTGIGKSIAKKFGANGYKVILLARSKEKLETVKSEIEKEGGKAEVHIVNLANIESINKFLIAAINSNKSIDLLVNVAGIWHDDKQVFADVNFEDFEQQVVLDTYSVGITAPALLVHGLLPLMSSNSNIINISGTFEDSAKGWLPYYVSKKAIEALTIGLSEELFEKGIRVNCISPSDTATEEYKKWFPEYAAEGLDPAEIADYAWEIVTNKKLGTGKIKILKRQP